MGKIETYSYDERGNLIETCDKDGNITKNKYDAQNRIMETIATDKETGKATTHTYAYEREEGQLSRVDNVQYQYEDISGGVTKEIIKGSKEIIKSTTYDVTGNRDSFTIQIGGKIQLAQAYEYDEFDRLETVREGDEEVAKYTYDANDNMDTDESDGSSSEYTYNLANQVTELNTPTAKLKASYRKNGQKIEKTSSVDGKTTYTYDSLGRLKKENGVEYFYDTNDNRTKMVNGKKTTRYRYNKNNELLREDNGRITAYHYDNRGNQVGTVLEQIEKVSDNTPAYTMSLTLGDNRLNGNEVNHYNALNQVETTLTRNYKIRYEYNADGLRTKKSVNTSRRGYVDTNYVWDGDQLVFELDKDYNIKKRYVRGQSLVYADTGEGTNKTYFVTDDQGSVIQLVDEQGTIIKTYSYDAFGTELSKDNNQTDDNPFRYCGEYHDIETGYIYLRARYYNPAVGRFISEDPIFDGDNWYVYCANDPINYADPSGLEKIVVSGSEYDKGRYKYNFIEPAIKSLKANGGTWIVSKTGYSSSAIKKMKNVAKSNSVKIVFITKAKQLYNYLNSKSISKSGLTKSRRNDTITYFTLFSHGLKGKVSLGYNQGSKTKSLELTTNTVSSNLKKGVFNKYQLSVFYSCNTGTTSGPAYSFAHLWAKIAGGTTKAAKGTTTYKNINSGESIWDKANRKLNGFNTNGSRNYPEASLGVKWGWFS